MVIQNKEVTNFVQMVIAHGSFYAYAFPSSHDVSGMLTLHFY